MSARDAILQRVRAACDRQVVSESVDHESWSDLVDSFPADVRQRLVSPTRHTQPDVGSDLADALIEQMEAVQMSVVRLQSVDDVVAAVDWYLQEQSITGNLCVAPALDSLCWQEGTRFGPALANTTTSVTDAMAAIAETGSLALASSERSPSTLNFLPENHIVVLYESQIVERTEDVWHRLRSMDSIPRALNLVTGPSRTGDIEQTIELGAHGPRRMHVLLIAADGNAQ